jgi:hypothetical protein
MTYDEWKLETPEDEEARHNRFWRGRGRIGWRDMRDADRCWNCRREWEGDKTDELLCAYCGVDAQDAPPERDPDDARDERLDRLYDDRSMTNYD